MPFDLQNRIARDALLLYRFRYVDPLTGNWVRARYVATIEEIRARHGEWQIIDGPEVRRGGAEMWRPFRSDRPRARSPLDPPPLPLHPCAIDAIEASLARVFLRRYVTWCARRRRFAAMEGAARLHRELAPQRADSAPGIAT